MRRELFDDGDIFCLIAFAFAIFRSLVGAFRRLDGASFGVAVFWFTVAVLYIFCCNSKRNTERIRFYASVQAILVDIARHNPAYCDLNFHNVEYLLDACHEADRIRKHHPDEPLSEGTTRILGNLFREDSMSKFEKLYDAYADGEYRLFAYRYMLARDSSDQLIEYVRSANLDERSFNGASEEKLSGIALLRPATDKKRENRAAVLRVVLVVLAVIVSNILF